MADSKELVTRVSLDLKKMILKALTPEGEVAWSIQGVSNSKIIAEFCVLLDVHNLDDVYFELGKLM